MTRALVVDSYLLSDAESVVARVRVGDPAALEILYRAYEAPVFNLARRICRSVEDAEDVLQDTFFEVYRSIGQYRGDGPLWGWIRRVAASKALMRLRRNKYRETDELHDEAHAVRREDTPPDGPGGRAGAADPTRARAVVTAGSCTSAGPGSPRWRWRPRCSSSWWGGISCRPRWPAPRTS